MFIWTSELNRDRNKEEVLKFISRFKHDFMCQNGIDLGSIEDFLGEYKTFFLNADKSVVVVSDFQLTSDSLAVFNCMDILPAELTMAITSVVDGELVIHEFYSTYPYVTPETVSELLTGLREPR